MGQEQRDKRKAEQKEAIIDLLPKKGYHIGKVCKAVGIARSTFYLWKEQDEDFDEATEEQSQYDIDDSEEKLRLLRQGLPRFNEDKVFIGWIVKPHFGALVKHLEAKAKDRGYGRHLQIEDGRMDYTKTMTDQELYDEVQRLNANFGNTDYNEDND